MIKKQKGIDLKFKSYKGESFSKRVYIVRKVQKATSTSPPKYWVNGKWLTQDRLKGTEQEDQKTKDMMNNRDREQNEKDDKEEQKQAEIAKENEKKRLAELAKKEKNIIIMISLLDISCVLLVDVINTGNKRFRPNH